jgi:hypothetical protein
LLGDGPRARYKGIQIWTRHPAVGAQHDVWIEDGEQRPEITGACCGKERIGDGPLAIKTNVGYGRALDPATSSAR